MLHSTQPNSSSWEGQKNPGDASFSYPQLFETGRAVKVLGLDCISQSKLFELGRAPTEVLELDFSLQVGSSDKRDTALELVPEDHAAGYPVSLARVLLLRPK